MVYFRKKPFSSFTHYTIEETQKLDIPKRSIEYNMVKNKSGEISFAGTLIDEKMGEEFLQELPKEQTDYKVNIDPSLSYDKELIVLTKKLIPILREKYLSGAIEFTDHKLLITGDVINISDIERVDSLLNYSMINGFNATKVVSGTVEMASELEMILSQDDSLDQNISETELDHVVDNLKAIAEVKPIKKKPEVIKPIITKESIKVKPKVAVEVKKSVKVEKRVIAEQKEVQQEVVPQVEAPTLSEAEAYRLKLQNSKPDEDILSLPTAQTVDMDIEEKISRGEVAPLTTKMPMVHEETIYLSE